MFSAACLLLTCALILVHARSTAMESDDMSLSESLDMNTMNLEEGVDAAAKESNIVAMNSADEGAVYGR
ncbi:hypothetical protein ACHWQZ_G005713 [Mnemiopsis leidyi]